MINLDLEKMASAKIGYCSATITSGTGATILDREMGTAITIPADAYPVGFEFSLFGSTNLTAGQNLLVGTVTDTDHYVTAAKAVSTTSLNAGNVIFVPIETATNIYSTATTLYCDAGADITAGSVRIAVQYREGLSMPIDCNL